MSDQQIESICPTNRQQWREWLEENHVDQQSVWLICYKKKSGMPTISWSEAVDEALCFGWIDSVRKTIDDERYRQYYSKRKARSTWSKVNKEKVSQLINEGRMTDAGLESIRLAKQNGSWTILDGVEALRIPDDLEEALSGHPGASAFFTSQSKSVQKMMLAWVALARRDDTRQKRIREIADCAGQQEIPKAIR